MVDTVPHQVGHDSAKSQAIVSVRFRRFLRLRLTLLQLLFSRYALIYHFFLRLLRLFLELTVDYENFSVGRLLLLALRSELDVVRHVLVLLVIAWTHRGLERWCRSDNFHLGGCDRHDFLCALLDTVIPGLGRVFEGRG